MVRLAMQSFLLLLVVPFAGCLRKENPEDDGELSVSACNPNVVEDARKLLGEVTKERIMSLLAMEEAEFHEMLAALKVKTISLDTLCASAITHIKDILHKDVPLHSDEACLTADCSTTMSVSDEKLAEEDAAVDLDKINLGDDLYLLDGNDTADPGPYKPNVEQLLRRLLAILFRVHPQIDIYEVLEGSPVFDASLNSRQRQQLQTAYSGASARLSAAIRKVNAGVSSSMLQKYFKASSGFTSTLKRHLSLTFDSLSNAYTKYPGNCPRGASAYVMAQIYCTVTQFRACGRKVGGRHEVNYCGPFFAYASYMPHVVIHEHSHHFGTKDKAYHKPAIFSLSASNMQNNADTYAHFAKDILSSTSWSPPSPPTWSPPSPPSWSPPSPPSWSPPSPPSWSPPSPPAPSPPSWSVSCFPPDAQVRVASQEHQYAEKSIGSLAPGDALYDEAGRKNDFLFDFHEDDAGRLGAMVSYLRIEHSLQKEGRPLFITKDHLVFACTDETSCEKEAMPAGEIAAGTHFLLAISTENGSLVPSKVTSVEAVVLQGFAGPFSSTGTLIVEGVLASSYAMLSDRQVSLWKRAPAWLRTKTQSIFHLLSLPLRWARLLAGAKASAYVASVSGLFDRLSDALIRAEVGAVAK